MESCRRKNEIYSLKGGRIMHIGVDGNLLCGKKTGMGMVVYNVIKFWKASDECRITLFVPDKLDDKFEDKLYKNGIEVKKIAKSNYIKWEQVILPNAAIREKIDVLWCPYNTAPLFIACKCVVTIHDIIYMYASLSSAPTFYKKMGLLYRKICVPFAARKATKIFTVSNFAKNEIAEIFPKQKSKIEVIYNSVDYSKENFNPTMLEDFFKKNHVKKPYILGFGSLEKRKNSLGLIKAFESLPNNIKERYQLVLFGFRGFEGTKDSKYIKKNNINNIVILDYISEQEKNALYSNSTMFVFPTFSEGFGIPILEAFTNKTPVITSNRTSLPEVAGDAALFVEPDKLEDLRDKIMNLIELPQLRNELIEKGIKQKDKFDWENTSTKIFEMLNAE